MNFYIHCGLPKTGTTALQAALRSNELKLLEAGFLYPYEGSLDRRGVQSPHPSFHAHHNVAWELTRSRFFDEAHGTLASLEQEVSGFSGNVIISCEDLESLLHDPVRLSPLVRIADKTKRHVVLVIYLRHQISYAESLYQELLKDGYADEYGRMVSKIVKWKTLQVKECDYQFDYNAILNRLYAELDCTIIVRNYHDMIGGSTISDFGVTLGLGSLLESRTAERRENARDDKTVSLLRFYRNRTGRDLTRREKVRARHVAGQVGRLASSSKTQLEFVTSFRPGNLELCGKFGLSTVGLDMEGLSERQGFFPLENFFSFESECAIRTGASRATSTGEIAEWLHGVSSADEDTNALDVAKYWTDEFSRRARWYMERLRRIRSSRRRASAG